MSEQRSLAAAAMADAHRRSHRGSGEIQTMVERLCGPSADEHERQLWHQLQRATLVGLVASSYIHDLNNLLTVIQGSAVLAADELPPHHPATSYLSDIHRASRSAGDLSRRLTAFLRRQPIAPSVVDLRALLAEWAPLLERLLGTAIQLSLRVAPDAWPILADPVQFEQLVMNLLHNARDAMPEGGVLGIGVANVRLEGEEGLPAGEYVCMTVSDTGIGMPPEVLERLFEPFFSAKGVTHGTGLGLATCRCIVAELGGAIRVSSAPGAGSTFSVYLPRAVGGKR